KFLNCMYGFRPNRSCHTAVKALYDQINFRKITRIVDADIKGFFDHMKHEWILKFLNYYIKDKNILWLVNKYLKAGIIDNGSLVKGNEGTAQGNIISPVLANIYMHYVLTLWFYIVVAKECKGECFLVVYADDFIAGFQYPWEAERFYEQLKSRMEKFGLELEESKSRIVESGRYLANAKAKQGDFTRLGSFDFLGFTFYCGKTKNGKLWIMPKTSSKKFRQKLKEMKIWLYDNKEQKLKTLMYMLNIKLIGHYRYYGISFNSRMISNFKQQVRELLFRALNRRSQLKSYNKEGFYEMMKYCPLALPRIYVSLFG
ncbi:MAG: group II intron reverse transcriptase/maturase, partial [Clostridia bacterium]|nr:group II intron reverse transcriptase/maturase [Clostridia bacterium]